MSPPVCSPLLALPTTIRQQIFRSVLAHPRPTLLREGNGRATGLLNTCKQIQKEVRLLCLPEDVTDIYSLMIRVHIGYCPLAWLRLTPSWMVDSGEIESSDFGIANLDDPLLMRLIQQIKVLGYVMVYIDEPTEGNPLDSFLLQFAKVQDVVTLFTRFKHRRFMIRVNINRHIKEYGPHYWWKQLEFPPGFGGLTSSQGGRYYEYLTMPFAEVGNFEDANAVIRVEELFIGMRRITRASSEYLTGLGRIACSVLTSFVTGSAIESSANIARAESHALKPARSAGRRFQVFLRVMPDLRQG